MIKFIRKYEKQLLALVGVFLMVSFVATMGPTNCGRTNVGDYVEGKYGSQKVHHQQVVQAANELEFLAKRLLERNQFSPGNDQWDPLLQDQDLFPPGFIEQLGHSGLTYCLLQLEARDLGLAPDAARADQILNSPRVAVAMSDGSRRSIDTVDESTRNDLRIALGNLLMVQSAFERAVTAIKVSDPLFTHDLSQRAQQIKARVVDFLATDYEKNLPEPTADELARQFDKFGDVELDAPPADSNPFGFGYKYPNRVKLQYIAIPRLEVRKAVKAMKDDYNWEVDANSYYLQHPSEFPTTQPAATQEALSLGPTSRAAPGTRPFAEVREQIMTRLVEPLVDKLQAQIQSDLNDRLRMDYETWTRTRGSTTAPTTAMAAAPAPGHPPYDSFEYLQHLAEQFQNKYHVTLTVASIADSFQSAKELNALQGLGQVSAFANYATSRIVPFMPAGTKNTAGVIDLFQPSPVVEDPGHDRYIFRITAADPAHKPKDIAEVRDQVVKDWKQQKALDLAKADAEKLLAVATTQPLDEAAASKPVVTTGFYPMDPSFPIENYKLAPQAQRVYLQGTYEMLGSLPDISRRRPTTMVSMPTEGKVAVAEIIAVESRLTPDSIGPVKSYLTDQLLQQNRMSLVPAWFSYEAVAQRLGYQDEAGRGKSQNAPVDE